MIRLAIVGALLLCGSVRADVVGMQDAIFTGPGLPVGQATDRLRIIWGVDGFTLFDRVFTTADIGTVLTFAAGDPTFDGFAAQLTDGEFDIVWFRMGMLDTNGDSDPLGGFSESDYFAPYHILDFAGFPITLATFELKNLEFFNHTTNGVDRRSAKGAYLILLEGPTALPPPPILPLPPAVVGGAALLGVAGVGRMRRRV